MDEKIEIPMAFWRDIKNALNQYVEEEGGKDSEFAEASYHKLLSYGASPQEARNVLPLSLKTELIMTGTYSNWTDMLKLRMDEAAHPQMREVATQAREQAAWRLTTIKPNAGR